MMEEIQGQMDTYDTGVTFQEFFKPVGENHAGTVAKKIQGFKEKHPEVDLGAGASAKSLLELSTEQVDQLKTSSKAGSLCKCARPVIYGGSGMFCMAIFSWNMDFFNVAMCYISMTIPFEAVCNPINLMLMGR